MKFKSKKITVKPELSRLVILFIISIVFSACKTEPVADIHVSNIQLNSNGALSMEQVAYAIKAAGVELDWNMKEVKLGHIIGTFSKRSHSLAVNITYTTGSYDIRYRNSQFLLYNPKDYTIHQNYNYWVKELDSAIKSKLAGI